MSNLVACGGTLRLPEQRCESHTRSSYRLAAIAIVAALTALRLIGLRLSVVDLYADEAQYWRWSQDLALGYYSKPALLAWIIAAAGRVCGSDEWCVRAPAPLFYAATSLVAYGIGRRSYDERTGFWAALLTASSREPVLFVTGCSAVEQVVGSAYAEIKPLGRFAAPIARSPQSEERVYYGFELNGARGPIPPLGGC